MKESRYPLAITIVKFPDDVCLILLKSHFNACLECQIKVLLKLNLKNLYTKSIDFQKKKIFLPAIFEPATSWMQVSCSTHWAIVLWFSMECCSSFPLLRLQLTAECKLISTLTCSDKLEVGRWLSNGVTQLICWCRHSQASYQHDGHTDRRFFSFIKQYSTTV